MSIFSERRSPSLESVSIATSLSSFDENPDSETGPSIPNIMIPEVQGASQGDSVVNWIQGELKDWLHERVRMRGAVPSRDDEQLKLIEALHATTDSYPMHERFCFPAENIYLLVNGVIYSVHRYFFERDSASFVGQGLSRREPMVLAGISTRDLDLFLSILYPSSFGLYSASTVDEWSRILRLADKWSFDSIRVLAITQLALIASPIDKIVLGRRYGVNGWLPDAYGTVCVRPAALTLEEGRRLGVDDVIRINAIRQEFYFVPVPVSSLTRLSEVQEQVESRFGLTIQTPPSASVESCSEDDVLPDHHDDEATGSKAVGLIATGPGYFLGKSPAPATENPVENSSKGPALAPAAAKKCKTATSKSASKAAPAVAAPKTPVERTRSNNWASLSVTAPEFVIASPVVGAEFNSFNDTFQLQDCAAKNKADVITPTPSLDMSAPAPQTEKSLFGAPSPLVENSSSLSKPIGGSSGAYASFRFGRFKGSAPSAGGGDAQMRKDRADRERAARKAEEAAGFRETQEPLAMNEGGAPVEPAVDFDPLDDPAWNNLAPKEKKNMRRQEKDRLEREKREKELADFMNEQDEELNPTSSGCPGGAGDDMAALMGAAEPAPQPRPVFDPLNDPAWDNLAPKEKKKMQKLAKDRLDREKREKELADFMDKQDAELNLARR